jgi:meiotic recombination protein SPO11
MLYAAPGPPPHYPHLPQLEEDFIRSNPEWVKELELMLATKVKAEIQALSSFGFQYLSQVYLPLKLQEGDWI